MSRTELFARSVPGGLTTIAGVDKHPGAIYFVSSVTGTNLAGYGANPDAPVATLAYALATMVPAPVSGDVIYVLPGHAESLTAASAITAIAGVKVVGLGVGAARPTFTFSTVSTATWAIAAANFSILNIRVTSTVAGLVQMFVITAAGCTLDTIDYLEDGTHDALQFANLSSAATDCTIQNCSWIQTTTAASALSVWLVYVAAHRLRVINNYVVIKGYATSNPANGMMAGATTLTTNMRVASNTCVITNSTGNIPISCFTGDTGFAEDNYVASTKSAIAGSIALASLYGAQNFAGHVVNKNGLLEPVVDA